MIFRQRLLRLYEDKEVFVIDKKSDLYGKKLVVDFFLADGTPSFRDATTKHPVDLQIEQVSDHPPEETQKTRSNNSTLTNG